MSEKEKSFEEKVAELENPLEKEFITACVEANELIDAKIDEAIKLIREATAISEKYGVPFRSGASLIRNTYTPQSFETKFRSIDFYELEEDLDYDLYENRPGEYGGGWEHSAVC